MSKRTKWLLSIGVIAALVIGWQVAAFAVHETGAFELDGNATSSTTNDGPPDDWDRVCHEETGSDEDCSTTFDTNNATATEWVAETDTNASIFTGGGSKDPEDINQWAWKDGAGGLPDKDNLLHSFAARYSLDPSAECPVPDGSPAGTKCEVLYFGSDRFDNSGDAVQGFWFFQDKITQVGTSSGTFSGVHRNGDLLVLSDFSNGGTTSTINVYKWDSTCTKGVNNPTAGQCADKNLRLLASSAAANCADPPGPADDRFCGIVNPTNGTVAPWPYTDKSGNHTYLQGEFFEGGVNLTGLGLGDRCFASVASESRASTSTTAVLKDFVLGEFGECGSTVTTAQQGEASKSIGTGSISVTDKATVKVTGVQTWNGTVQFSLKGPTNTPGVPETTQTIGNPKNVSNTTPDVTSDPATVTAVGHYCWSAKFTSGTTGVPDDFDDGVNECFDVTPVTPTLTTTAGDDVNLGSPITDTANLTGTASKPGTPAINPTTAGGPAGGSITFTLLGPDNCQTVAFTSGPVTVNGDGSYDSPQFTPTAPGTYHWVADYTGDLPNTNGKSHNTDCSDANEDVVVSKSEVKTTPKTADDPPNDIPPGGLSIGTGSVDVKDSAAITVTGASTWEGTVQFHLCGPLDAPATCDTGGTAIGSPVTVINDTTPILSPAATVTSAGRYCWRADFEATTAGVPNGSDSSGTECFTVNPVTPTLTTQASADVDLGNPISDTATLGGTANKPGTPLINPTTAGGPAGGKITFNLYGPDDADCSGTAVYTKEVTVTGNGDYNSDNFTPTEPGTYRWVATYSGDPPNTNAKSSDCTDPNEDVVVTSVPSSMTTAQSFIPNDSATVSADQGGALDGSVTFKLFESDDCGVAGSDPAIHTETVDVNGVSPQTVSTTNTTHSTTAANVSWLVSYDSDNPAQEDIPATCLEKTALAIDNGGTIPPPPSP